MMRRIASLVVALVAHAGTAVAAWGPIEEFEVTFEVVNQNRTDIPCEGDGSTYTLRGHLVGPRKVLAGPGPHVVALYLYGFDTGEWNFRFGAVPGYDLPRELAARGGHVSLTLEMLGYDPPYPHGDDLCLGTQADIAHQIVQTLRLSGLTLGSRKVVFERVVLAGHDVAGGMAEIAAYTFQDLDGLMLLTWADQGITPYVLQLAAEANQVCGPGGQSPEPGAPGGYMRFGGDDESFASNLFYAADPDVVAAALALRQLNPCGYLASIPPTFAIDGARLGEVTVPVLLMTGERDPVFLQEGWEAQAAHFTGNDGRTTSILVADAAHFPMLERVRSQVFDDLSSWLLAEGFCNALDLDCDGVQDVSLPALASGLRLLLPGLLLAVAWGASRVV